MIGIGLDASAKLEYISKCIFKGSEITLVVLSRNEKSTITDYSYRIHILYQSY